MTPMLSIVLQTEAPLRLIESLVPREALEAFEMTQQPLLTKDSDLGLPPGTLGASALDGSLPSLASVVDVVTFHRRAGTSACARLIDQLELLTEIGRQLAASPATRALLIHEGARVVTRETYLQLTQRASEGAPTPLLVWLRLEVSGERLQTWGLSALALPEIVLETAGHPPGALEVEAVLATADRMLQRRGTLAEGMVIPSGERGCKVTRQGAALRLVPIEDTAPAEGSSRWPR